MRHPLAGGRPRLQIYRMPYASELEWLRSSVGVLSPANRTLISIGGDDAQEWLQGQLTNQCEGMQPGESVYGFILSLKGRVMTDAWAYFHEGGVWLEVAASEIELLLERLDRYIIMEDVDLEHRPDLRVLIAQGPKSRDIVARGWPSDRLGTGGVAWLVDEGELGAELGRASDRAAALGGGRLSEEAWRQVHVALGRPTFGADFGDWTYPQETGLTGAAVSFNKGCYVGQETVVMLQNRGKAPKQLWCWQIEDADPPTPKTPITRGDAEVGEVTSSALVDGAVQALGFLKRGQETEQEGFEIQGRSARPTRPVTWGPATDGGHA